MARSGARGMTTAACPCALVTPAPRSTLGGRPAYPVCTHWALAREYCAPPLNPRPLALLPEQRTHRGAVPRTPAPVRSWRRGRTVVVPAHVSRAE